ncbi:MAG: GTPase [Gemmataceae bacterium]
MAVNLPPQYHDADARYKKATTAADKLVALREMWVILPKHKASEKVQMLLKTKISELTDQIEQEKSGPKKAAPGTFKIPRQGAGTVVLLGPPNAGKSMLLSKLTKAKPEVAAYPFTTREPIPGMMDFENVRVQLVDLPPVTADHYDTFVTDITRGADAAVLFLDLAKDDGPAETQAVIDRLKLARRVLVKELPAEDDPATYSLRTIVAATKSDDEAADIRLEMAKEWLGDRFPLFVVSAETGAGLDDLRRAIFDSLRVMRVQTKQPGKPVDPTGPPFTCPVGSTVAEFAGCVHSDFEEKVKSARVWGTGVTDGQTVGRDHVLHENDVVELHV